MDHIGQSRRDNVKPVRICDNHGFTYIRKICTYMASSGERRNEHFFLNVPDDSRSKSLFNLKNPFKKSYIRLIGTLRA